MAADSKYVYGSMSHDGDRKWSHLARKHLPLFILVVLQLAFATKALRDLCEHAAKAEAAYGSEVAATIRARVADLRAAVRISDVPVGRPVEIPEEPGTMSLSLRDGLRLVFRSNHNRTPETAGRVDWSRVTRIQLLRIERIR